MSHTEKIKLTSLSTKGGCGCKIGPADLAEVLSKLPLREHNSNLLVGLDTNDDAGVYKLTDELALVQTVDFFTPIVDDPYSFGQIAAANAISDIYAMGGKPLTVLNIVAFPIRTLDKSVLTEILRGASDKVNEAGATLVGGHSIDDNEPKFGLAVVTGFGLLGHAFEMAKGSHVGMRIIQSQVPVLPRVRELAEAGFVPGGTKNNFAHLQGSITYPETMDQFDR